jgi:hypothetical protein
MNGAPRALPLVPALLIGLAAFPVSAAPHVTHKIPSPPDPRSAAVGALPEAADVSHEVMGWVILSDGERVIRELSGKAGATADGPTLQAGFARAIGFSPAIARALDLKRPLGLAVLNPQLLQEKSVQPVLAMLPVRSRTELEQSITRGGGKITRLPWGFSVDSAEGRVFVAVHDGYALAAWRPELVGAVEALLGPRLRAHAEAPLLVHLSVDNLYGAYGGELDQLTKQLAMATISNGDPQTAFTVRSVMQLARYAHSVDAVEVLVSLDNGGLTLTARVDGRGNGAFTRYVQQQQPGPAWGVEFLPRDAVLAFATHASPLSRSDAIDAQVNTLTAAPTKKDAKPDPQADARVRQALKEAADSTDGELAYAVWPARHGGMGVGGAYRVNDSEAARKAVKNAYDQLAGRLGPAVLQALTLDPMKFADRVSVLRSTERIAGAKADVLHVKIRWPRDAGMERRVFEAMFGPQLELATVFIDDRALFALGPDHAERLTAMIAVAHGQVRESIKDEPAFRDALAYHEGQRVSLTYLETKRMANFAADLVVQSSELDAAAKAQVKAMADQVGAGAIVSATNVAGPGAGAGSAGGRYQVTAHVPRSAVAGAPRLDGALFRIALSPLMQPPSLPPMPVPPTQLTPTLGKGSNLPPTM